jgi:hypothetical protein
MGNIHSSAGSNSANWSKSKPWPELNITSIISSKPKKSIFDKTKYVYNQSLQFYEYLIWRYSKPSCTKADLVKELGIGTDSLGIIIRQYNLFPEKRIAGYYAKHKNPARNPDFERRCKQLFDQGLKTYVAIAKKLDCNVDRVYRVAVRNGWAKKNSCKQFEWITPKELPACTITSYTKYCHTIRHFTNKIYSRYAGILDPARLKGEDWHVDHCLSIYDAYNVGEVPLPWQLVVHPANLTLISRDENLHKGKDSSMTLKQLLSKIRRFESLNGKVFLPVVINSDSQSLNYKYLDKVSTVAEKIKRVSKFSVSDIKYLWKNGATKPKYTSRKHRTREHYEYVVYCSLLNYTQKEIADSLGCNQDYVKCILRKVGLPTKSMLISSAFKLYAKRIFSLRRKGYTLTQIANKLKLTKLTVIFMYYRFKEINNG